MPLQTRLKLLIIVMALSIVAVLVYASSRVLQLEQQQSRNAQLRGQRVLWDSILANQISQLALMASQFAEDGYLLEAVASRPKRVSDIVADSFDLLGDVVFNRLDIVAADHSLLFSSRGATSVVSQNWLGKVLETDTAQQGIEWSSTTGPLLSVVLPLHLHGKLIGAMRVASDLSEALRHFSDMYGAKSFLVDNDGILLKNSQTSLYKGLLAGLNGKLQTADEIPVDGHWYRVAVTPTSQSGPASGVHLLTATDATKAVARQRAIRWRAWLTAALIIAGLLLLQHIFLQRIFSPLSALHKVVRRFGRGETGLRSGFTRQDEVGELGRGFDTMAQRIEDSLALERERNADMQNAVQRMLVLVRKAAEGDFSDRLELQSKLPVVCDLAQGLDGMSGGLGSLLGSVKEISLQLASSASQLSEATQCQRTSASQQAASSGQVNALANRIRQSSQTLVEAVQQVAACTANSADKADNGRIVLEHLKTTSDNMTDATARISAKLALLSEKADKINTVIDLINRVADQTNLLSLNAAIEAEKAGEYGVGFAVVAAEIRRLADQTAVATWDIGQTVTEIQSAVATAVMGMDVFREDMRLSTNEIAQAGACLADIITQISELAPNVDQVQEGILSHAASAESIAENIAELRQVALQNAETATESGSVAQQLQQTATRLKTLTLEFRL